MMRRLSEYPLCDALIKAEAELEKAAVAIEMHKQETRKAEAERDALNKVIKRVQAITSIYLEPGDNRLVTDEETINAIISVTDNADICRLQREIASHCGKQEGE